MHFSSSSTSSTWTILITLGCLMLHASLSAAQLTPTFYDRSCPNVTNIVRETIVNELRSDPRIAASILRLHFHDCFVNGCDASILLDNTTSFRTEKDAFGNANSARGFPVIDRMKAAVERACPRTVSCADMLTIAAQQSVTLAGGPSWRVPLGRRDSLQAFLELANANLPAPFFTLPQLKASFRNVGLDRPSDLVALSGGHTFGKNQCQFILDRLYNFSNLPGSGSGPLPTVGSGAAATGLGAGAGSVIGGSVPDNTLVFFMHDILGGSNPTARAVTGVVANAALSGQIPFAKPNGANLPVSNGVPSDNNNNGILNNNNVPLLVGLGGTTSNILQNNGNNMLNGLPVANGGQLPSGSSLQMLMFGTLTVMDNELTEGHELGSGLLGKAQGFYVASALDGTSQTMAFTAMFESGGYEDSISFFGVHRTAASESHLGVMGGTGKYVNARGFAIVKTFTGSSGTQQQQPHQFTDGLETVLECTVYLSY